MFWFWAKSGKNHRVSRLTKEPTCLPTSQTCSGRVSSGFHTVFTSLDRLLVACGSQGGKCEGIFEIQFSRKWKTGGQTAYDYLGKRFCPATYGVQNNLDLFWWNTDFCLAQVPSPSLIELGWAHILFLPADLPVLPSNKVSGNQHDKPMTSTFKIIED